LNNIDGWTRDKSWSSQIIFLRINNGALTLPGSLHGYLGKEGTAGAIAWKVGMKAKKPSFDEQIL
jgi:hypothetical protein